MLIQKLVPFGAHAPLIALEGATRPRTSHDMIITRRHKAGPGDKWKWKFIFI